MGTIARKEQDLESNHIVVQAQPIAVENFLPLLQTQADCGAVVTFTGQVRDHNLGDQVLSLTLEHYPGMTEQVLTRIVAETRERWQLGPVVVVHRIGRMEPGELIVMVGVASDHRHSAFAACQCIMDRLKTEAPFWKKEQTEEGARWVAARCSDEEAASQWRES